MDAVAVVSLDRRSLTASSSLLPLFTPVESLGGKGVRVEKVYSATMLLGQLSCEAP